jgi:fermentation-respiration switch protein FrsA (DUF1100 family)
MNELKVGMKTEAEPERVTFSSESVELIGEFRAVRSARPQAGVVLTGPFTGVKEQVTGTYAAILAAAGFATLAFDHRGFGESGGRTGHEDSQGKLADLRAAVSVLASRPEVDAHRIGAVGVCLGGGYAVRAAAGDPRIKAVAAIAGAYNSPARMLQAMGAGPYKSALADALDRYDEYLPAVAPGGGEAAMGGEEPYAYYGTARSSSPHWRNQVTRGSLHSLMTFDALGAAELLADIPLLVVHGKADAYCSPELAQALYERKPGEKELLWLEAGQHTDLYDSEPHVTRAAEATAVFLRAALTRQTAAD